MEPYREEKIFAAAIAALRRQTGLEIEEATPTYSAGQFDHALRVKGIPGLEYTTEVKRWAGHANFGALVNSLSNQAARPLLIADYINPNLANRLREHGIEFIDTSGNAYLDIRDRLFVFTVGNKPEKDKVDRSSPSGDAMRRIQEPSGLRIVFAFLCKPGLINEPYREIASTTRVAIGTVGGVLRALKEGGYMVEGKAKGKSIERRLMNRDRLLERWAENYPLRLRPKLHLGDFVAADRHWWKQVKSEEYGCHWSGELAADQLTGNLRAEAATVYLPEAKLVRFLTDNRLRKFDSRAHRGMTVSIYEQFWSSVITDEKNGGLVPPLLAYADLIATGDPRNIENAREIKERYFAEPEWKD